MIENIEKFKCLHLYDNEGMLSKEKCEELGLPYEHWESLEESAYQCVYDISEDWAKEQPTWDDVKLAYKMGVEDGIKYINIK